MCDTQSEKIAGLLCQLYPAEADDITSRPDAQTFREIPAALLSIANESSKARDKVVRALIELLEALAEAETDAAFHVVCDLLGRLKAVEAIDILIKYIDYQPGYIGNSLHSKPAVKGLVQIGEPAISKIGQALLSGESVLHPNNYRLRTNAVTALIYIGGKQAKGALETAFAAEKDEEMKQWLNYAIQEIDRAEDEKRNYETRIKTVEFE